MFQINKQEKTDSRASRTLLHNWDRENELEATQHLGNIDKIESLSELFEMNRIVHHYKERKGVKGEKADTGFLPSIR